MEVALHLYCNVAIVTFDILQNGDRNLSFTDGTSMVHFTQCLFHLYNEDSFNDNEDCFILYICILYVYICTTSTNSLYSRTMPRAVLALFSSIRLSYLVYTSYLESFS